MIVMQYRWYPHYLFVNLSLPPGITDLRVPLTASFVQRLVFAPLIRAVTPVLSVLLPLFVFVSAGFQFDAVLG